MSQSFIYSSLVDSDDCTIWLHVRANERQSVCQSLKKKWRK